MWTTLKRQSNQYKIPSKEMLELWKCIEDYWTSITPNKCIETIISTLEL